MRSFTTCLLLLVFFAAPGSRARAQNSGPAGQPHQSAASGATATGATKEEVDQLRQEVAAQRQTIEQLKSMVQQLLETRSQAPAAESPQLVNATLVPVAPAQAMTSEKPAEKKEGGPTAGWNGDHFYIKSSDGQFQIQPIGYAQADYRAYSGDGAPADTFVIRRARFGFQGSYGKYYDWNILIDAAASNGLSLRDLYLAIKPYPEFVAQVGQFKEPFAQELMQAVTNIDFVERSLASLLYPSAATAFRSPGAVARGDIYDGRVQYWVGAFNGKGILTNNFTNQPEVITRLRFYPWKKKKDSLFQGFAFGGAFAYGRTRGLSSETSFTATNPDSAFTFFPSFRINGPTQRYNGEFTWVHGPWAIRGEYDQLNQHREGVGSEASGGLGFNDLPTIVAKAGYIQGTYLLTGETRPENAPPKVKHPLFGPETPGGTGPVSWGAWEVAFRYDKIQAKEPGVDQLTAFTPALVPTFANHTQAFTFGLNWYPNYWTRYMLDFGIDQLQQPSTIGALPQNYFVVLQRLQFRF
ncbi:MAG TPA: porin [Candidatus Angelobacter sp.]